jgi:histidinol-phosphate aminotransferase
MTDTLHTIKQRVRELSPYSLKRARASIKLNQNENPWDAPLRIKEEVLRRLEERRWSQYPDFVPESLHQRLAEHSGWRPDGIIAGNGSNELIQAVLMVTLAEGKRVLISEPTFALYRQISNILGADVISVPLNSDLEFDLPALKFEIELSKPEVVVICSPNNPTGCVMSHSDLARILEATQGLVVIDEAYFEFSGQTVLPLLEQHENLIVLRTFSKAMALAALRVGYLLAAPALVREISKSVLPYNLNVFSQTAAEVAIEMHPAELKPLISLIRTERDRLCAELMCIPGLTPIPSRANFMLLRSTIPPDQIYEELLQRDILIRNVGAYPLLQDCFRISVGTPAENDFLISTLREVFEVRRRSKSKSGPDLMSGQLRKT